MLYELTHTCVQWCDGLVADRPSLSSSARTLPFTIPRIITMPQWCNHSDVRSFGEASPATDASVGFRRGFSVWPPVRRLHRAVHILNYQQEFGMWTVTFWTPGQSSEYDRFTFWTFGGVTQNEKRAQTWQNAKFRQKVIQKIQKLVFLAHNVITQHVLSVLMATTGVFCWDIVSS